MINETTVKCFLSLGDTLSFTKTASDLYMTQQAVSKNISRLEERLGFPLFERSHHGVAMTPLGEQFYAMFARFASEYEQALRSARMNQEGSYRTLNIGYQNWLDFGREPGRAMATLRKYNPNLFLVGERHSPVVLTEQLLAQKMDLVIMYKLFAPTAPGLNMRTIFRSPLVLMVSADHPLATPDATYETFLREPYIFDSFENEKAAEIHERAQRYVELWGLKPKQIIVMPNRDSAFTAAELGRGIIVTTEMNRIVQSSALKKYPMGQYSDIAAIWRDRPQDPVVEEYVEQLALEYQKDVE